MPHTFNSAQKLLESIHPMLGNHVELSLSETHVKAKYMIDDNPYDIITFIIDNDGNGIIDTRLNDYLDNTLIYNVDTRTTNY